MNVLYALMQWFKRSRVAETRNQKADRTADLFGSRANDPGFWIIPVSDRGRQGVGTFYYANGAYYSGDKLAC